MPTQEEIVEAIGENAIGPRSVSADGVSVEQHSIADQKEALTIVVSEEAAAQPHFGLRFTRLVPPGCG